MDRKDFTRHISGAMNASMEAIFNHILEMGGMVEKQIECAIEALQKNDGDLAKKVVELDKEVNRQEVEIDTHCARILARQQPTALDLRLILSAIRMAVDLERMGDESVKLAKFVIGMADKGLSCTQVSGLEHLIEISARSLKMLRMSLDGFARLSLLHSQEVIMEEDSLDELYKKVLADLTERVRQGGPEATCVLELIFALRAAERMSDHARNIEESLVYLVSGKDIRDMSDEEMQAFLTEAVAKEA